ncbi:MAG: hypothetical protein QOH03_5023, partial [Kribbellaceae bacterium]|nr:hypothetical protein [Kribbellaceae bacterium]
ADADPIKERDERILAAVGEEVASTIRRIHVVGEDEVPVTVTGKVRKVALRTDRLKATTAESNGASPETPFAGETSSRAAEQLAAATSAGEPASGSAGGPVGGAVGAAASAGVLQGAGAGDANGAGGGR